LWRYKLNEVCDKSKGGSQEEDCGREEEEE